MTRSAFHACPNGDPGEGWAHSFTGYAPGEHDLDKRPLIFCERCGETRLLQPPLAEPVLTDPGTHVVTCSATGGNNP